MNARPYVLPGEADRALLARRVAAALAAWRTDWLAASVDEPLPALACDSAPQAERWLAARGEHGAQLFLGCASGWLDALGALFLGAAGPAVGGAPAVAEKLAQAALEAFARQVLASFNALAASEMRWESAGLPQAWFAAGSGAAIYDLAPALPLSVALSPELVARSLPKASSREGRETLSPLSAALQTSAVELYAVVGEAQIDLAELARLAPSDVIVLERRLDEPLSLRLGTRTLGRIHLGTTGGAKAVQLVARPPG